MTTPLQYVQLLARNIIVLFKQVFCQGSFYTLQRFSSIYKM